MHPLQNIPRIPHNSAQCNGKRNQFWVYRHLNINVALALAVLTMEQSMNSFLPDLEGRHEEDIREGEQRIQHSDQLTIAKSGTNLSFLGYIEKSLGQDLYLILCVFTLSYSLDAQKLFIKCSESGKSLKSVYLWSVSPHAPSTLCRIRLSDLEYYIPDSRFLWTEYASRFHPRIAVEDSG